MNKKPHFLVHSLFILFLPLLTSCISVYIRDIPKIINSEELTNLDEASLVGCEKYELKKYELGCESKMHSLAEALKETQLFKAISQKNKNARYIITLKPYTRLPYYYSIGHSPGALILSNVIPFWEKDELGYSFSIVDHQNQLSYACSRNN